MTTRPSLIRGIRGTSSVGVFALATLSVGVGATYLGYHKHTTGHAIQKLVPEWEVQRASGDPGGLAMTPGDGPLCASGGFWNTTGCILQTTGTGAAGGGSAGLILAETTCYGEGPQIICRVAAGGIFGGGGLVLGGIGGLIGGVLSCPGGDVPVQIEPQAPAPSSSFSYTASDYQQAGVTLPAGEIAKLVAAKRCSPQEYLNRANRVHPRCDANNVKACNQEDSCALNQQRFEYMKECMKRRQKRDYCFGGPSQLDQRHADVYNRLQRQMRNCGEAMKKQCRDWRLRPDRRGSCSPGSGDIAIAPPSQHAGEAPQVLAPGEADDN